ncbi:MAG: acyl dehydratase [Paracoccaceae bacterium]|jgi:acyl dehydratase
MAITAAGLEDYDPAARPVPALTPAELTARVGQEIGVTDWIDITQSQVDAFGVATHDMNYIHVNPERTRADTPLPGTIAHGFLTLSLVSQMGYQVMPMVKGAVGGLNYGIDKARFTAPVPVGSRLRGRLTLADVQPRGTSGLVIAYDVVVELEGQEVADGGRPVLTARWLTHVTLGGV